MDESIALASANHLRSILSFSSNWKPSDGKAQYVAWANSGNCTIPSDPNMCLFTLYPQLDPGNLYEYDPSFTVADVNLSDAEEDQCLALLCPDADSFYHHPHASEFPFVSFTFSPLFFYYRKIWDLMIHLGEEISSSDQISPASLEVLFSSPPTYILFPPRFSSTEALYKDHIAATLNRINSVTGVAYKDDPAILAYNLLNEPRCFNSTSPVDPGLRCAVQVDNWVGDMSNYIKSIDPSHLVTVGSEGFSSLLSSPTDRAANPG